jgi:hypothetical protein
MPLVGFEATILVSERPKTHALDRTATGIGNILIYRCLKEQYGIPFVSPSNQHQQFKAH